MNLIRNKQESDILIKQLGLNRMLEGIFTKGEEEELIKFLNIYKYPYYNMRDKSKSTSQFLYKITAKEVLEHSKEYDKFSVYESLAEADKQLALQGDIQINSSFELMASLSDVKGISNRVAMQEPKYKLNIDMLYRKIPNIKGLNRIVEYIITHELFDVFVEFSLYDVPVGINKENILIWELRNY